MNVAELIIKLQEYSGDMKVLVNGYEGGFDPIAEINTIYVEPNPGANWYDGEYDIVFGDKIIEKTEKVVAIER